MVAQVEGVEPSSSVLETDALPLSYTHMERAARVELASSGWKPEAIAAITMHAIGASVGNRTRVSALATQCSTIELHQQLDDRLGTAPSSLGLQSSASLSCSRPINWSGGCRVVRHTLSVRWIPRTTVPTIASQRPAQNWLSLWDSNRDLRIQSPLSCR